MKTSFEIKKIQLLIFTLSLLFFVHGCAKDTSTNPESPEDNYGSVFVHTTPDGYNIILDDMDTGKLTPDTLKFIATGIHEISLESEIYLDSTYSISVLENEIASTIIDFTTNQKFYGKILCTSVPSNASIFIDDSSTEKYTPDSISNVFPGEHVIKCSHPLCSDNSKNVIVKSNETVSISLALADTTAWLNYNTGNSELPTNSLTCLDYNANIAGSFWIGTENNGLVNYDGINWTIYNTENSALPSNSINCISTDDLAHTWVGTDNGIVELFENTFTLYNTSNSPLEDNYITSISTDVWASGGTGRIYIGTQNGGVLVINVDGNMNNYTIGNSQLPSNIINNVFSGANGSVNIISTSDGFLSLNSSDDLANPDYLFTEDNSGLPGKNIEFCVGRITPSEYTPHFRYRMIINDNGAETQTFCWLEITEPWTNHIETWETVSLNFIVNNILQQSDEYVWLCTNAGLLKFSLLNEVEQYNISNSGLTTNNVIDICYDRQQRMWLATDQGLFRYKPD